MIDKIDYGGVYFTAMQRAAGEYLRGAGNIVARLSRPKSINF